tara:strand:- start:241 stop:2868 length:2628 start_codon:yes stop_codon:yes gene_type:complete
MSVKPTLQEQLQNNFGGNLNKKFGMTLPVPFIENITIDEAGENVTVKAAMYFNMDDYGDLNFGEFIGSLENLNSYTMLAFNREYTATSGSEMTSDNHLTQLINGDVDLLSQAAYVWGWVDTSGNSHLFNYPTPNPAASVAPNIYPFDPISEWNLVDTYYNDAGIPIKKLVTETTIPMTPTSIPGDASTYNFLKYIEGLSALNSSDRETIKDVGFLTFSSILPLYDEVVQPDAANNNLDEILYLKMTDPNNPMVDFYSSMTSDIGSFVFFKDGSLASPDRTIFVTAGGTIVEDPIMGLDLLYHSHERITIPDLIAYFKPLVGTTTDTTLQTMFDSLLTILETNGSDPQLLVNINAFLQSFADKSSVTAIGQFYGRALERLTKANTAVVQGPRVSKQLVNNPTVIDLRGTSGQSVYEGFDQEIISEDFIFQKSFYMNRQLVNEDGESDDDGGYLIDQGSFFFDYDKLLKEKSALAFYLDVQKVEDLFGSETLCNRFSIESVEMSSVKNDDNEIMNTIQTPFSETESNIPTGSMTVDYNYTVPSDLGNTYLYLRNFNLMNELGDSGLNTLNNGRFYKLMCFQYQHIIDLDDITDQDYETNLGYNISITLKDYTHYIYLELYDLVVEIQELLQEYYDLASESCSYNETDDFFNQFFIRAVEAKYSENPSAAPWVKAVFMYVYLKDLWDNAYGGDLDEILSQAKNLGATVGPEGGTLAALENLKNNYDSLMGNMFNEALVQVVRDVLEDYEDDNDGAAFYVEKTLNVTYNESSYVEPTTYTYEYTEDEVKQGIIDAFDTLGTGEYTDTVAVCTALGQLGLIMGSATEGADFAVVRSDFMQAYADVVNEETDSTRKMNMQYAGTVAFAAADELFSDYWVTE